MCVFDVVAARPFAQFDPELSSRQFGVEVARLTSDERTVPLVVEKLINYIEMHGLYTEGIYRKSGSTNKIKELKQGLDTGDCCMSCSVSFEWRPVTPGLGPIFLIISFSMRN